jgi:hypothetical protein
MRKRSCRPDELPPLIALGPLLVATMVNETGSPTLTVAFVADLTIETSWHGTVREADAEFP